MWHAAAFNYTDSCIGQNPYAGVLNSPFIVQYDKCRFNKRLTLGTRQLQNLRSLLTFFDGYGRFKIQFKHITTYKMQMVRTVLW
jgi:hypothetical protein